jgi:hypothetical protein
MNFTQPQYLLMYTAVRQYQEKYSYDRQTWIQCNEVLDELYPLVYTQRQEQPT